VGLITAAVFSLGKKGVVDLKSGLIALTVFAFLNFTKIHPMFILLVTGAFGAMFLA
jgi:chromate transport protein ChrA